MTDSEIEKVAREYGENNSGSTTGRYSLISGFIAGFHEGQKVLKEECENDFDKMICPEWQKTLNEHDLFQVKNIWSIAQLSKMGEIERLREENEKFKAGWKALELEQVRHIEILKEEFSREIEKLEKENEELRNSLIKVLSFVVDDECTMDITKPIRERFSL